MHTLSYVCMNVWHAYTLLFGEEKLLESPRVTISE